MATEAKGVEEALDLSSLGAADDVAGDVFRATTVRGPLDLVQHDDLADDDIPVDDVLRASGTRAVNLGLTASDIRIRWRALVNRLRGYRADAVLVERVPVWVPVLTVDVPPGGRATLRYEAQEGRHRGSALRILGLGFGSSQSVSIARSVQLRAEASGKSFEWKLLATVTRYVDRGGGPELRKVDLVGPEGAPECRVVDLPVSESAPAGFPDDGRWRTLNRLDLTASADTGHATWRYRLTRRASWTARVAAAPLQALAIDLLTLESDQSEQFDVDYELPYGGDYVFYCRSGEWPLTPRCALTADGFGADGFGAE